jgi:hypothetical protein
MGFHQWSRRSLLALGVSFIAFGIVTLTAISFTKPWVKRPQVVAEQIERSIETIERKGEAAIPGIVGKREMEESPLEGAISEEEKATVSKSAELSMVIPRRGINEKVVIIGEIKRDKKTPAKEGGYKDTIFGREITKGDIKTEKKIGVTISAREEPSASDIQKKSMREIPGSHPAASETVEMERERGVGEPPRTRTPKQQDKRVGFGFEEKMAERNREKNGDERISKKDMKVKGKGSSPIGISSPLVKSETAISANKSSIAGQARVIQPEHPTLIATEEEVRQFFADYVERYNQKDIDGFLSLFSPKAIQNGRDRFNEIRKIYSDFFDQSRELRYYLTDTKIEIYQKVLIFGLFYESAALVEARYQVDQILNKKGKKKVWTGDIRWILVREDEVPKILCLDFKPQKARAGETPKGGLNEGPDPMTHF